MILENDIEELPGYAVVDMKTGFMVIRDNSDWYTFVHKTGHAIKTQKLPNMRMKWGYVEDW